MGRFDDVMLHQVACAFEQSDLSMRWAFVLSDGATAPVWMNSERSQQFFAFLESYLLIGWYYAVVPHRLKTVNVYLEPRLRDDASFNYYDCGEISLISLGIASDGPEVAISLDLEGLETLKFRIDRAICRQLRDLIKNRTRSFRIKMEQKAK